VPNDAPHESGPAERPPTAGDTARKAASARIEGLRMAGTVGTVGLSFVLAIVIGGALGWWLDRVTGLEPVFFWIFLVIGILAGFRSVYVILRPFLK
jgi:F0F1-type ATP synthase assembly protein I